MKELCDECVVKLVPGFLSAQYGTVFIPETERKKFIPKASEVICDCCPRCGKIYNIRIKDPKQIVREQK